MSPSVYPIQSARLALRPVAPGDLDDLLAYMSREDVVRCLYGGVKVRAEREQGLKLWMSSTTAAHKGERLVLAVVCDFAVGVVKAKGDFDLLAIG